LRAAIFIDGAYMLSLFKTHDVQPDYEAMAEYFLKPIRKTVPLDLLRCYFYYCAPWMSPEPTEDEKRRMEEHEIFMAEIRKIERWGIRLGKLQKRRDGYKEYYEQKRVDVLLSVDMVRHSAAGHIQHAVLVAGDSDFIPAVEAAKESGATVSLWCSDDNTVHKDLIDLADIVHRIDWKNFPKLKGKKLKQAEAAAESRKDKQQGGVKRRRRPRRKSKVAEAIRDVAEAVVDKIGL
jgi:uncharacterized LabA/DUF88 family protein